MPHDIFTNEATTTVSSGGTTAPSAGTSESWTVAAYTAFPAASSSAALPTAFRVVDPALPSEVMLVTNVSGTSWTVTRGAEGTTPVAHTTGFTINHVVTAGFLGTLGTGPGWYNVLDFGAVADGSTDNTTAFTNALNAAAAASPTSTTSASGVVWIPPGMWVTGPLTVPHGVVVRGAGMRATSLIMKANSADASAMFTNGSTATMISILDMRLLGNLTNQTNTVHGVVLSGTGSGSEYHDQRSEVRSLVIQDFTGDGLTINGTGVDQVNGVQAWNNKGHGFWLGIDSELSDCDAGQNGRDGFHITGNTKVANCKAWYSGWWNNGSSASVQTGNVLQGTNILDTNTAGIETSAAGWTAGSNTTIAQSTTQAHTGTHSLSITVTATGNSSATTTSKYTIVGGNQYSMQGYVYAPGTGKTATLAINWYTAGGTLISTSTGSSISLTSAAWTQVYGIGDAPRNAAQASMTITVIGGTSSQIFYWDDATLFCNGLMGNGFNFYGANALSVATGIYAQDNARVGISLQVDGTGSSTSRVCISGYGVDTNNNNSSGTSYANIEFNDSYGCTLDGGFSLARGSNAQAPAYCVSFAGGSSGNIVQFNTSGFSATTKVGGGYSVFDNSLTIDGSGGFCEGLGYSSSITPDITSQNLNVLTLTGSPTINAPSQSWTGPNPLTFFIQQDSTGGHKITWNATYKTTWQPDPKANAVSSISFMYDDDNAWWTPVSTVGGYMVDASGGNSTMPQPVGAGEDWVPSTVLAQTYPRWAANSSSVATGTTGVVCLYPIWIPGGTLVTNINFITGGTAAVSPTHQWWGLCDNTKKLLAATADGTSTAMAASTLFTKALSAAYTTLYSGYFYVAMSITASTMPNFAGVTPAGVNISSALDPYSQSTTTTANTPSTVGTSYTKSALLGCPYFYLT